MKILDSLLKNPIGNSVAWSAMGSIISKGLIFIAWIVVARILGAGKYGEFGLIRNTIFMFTVFAGFGLNVTAVKYIAQYTEEHIKALKLVKLILYTSSFMGGIFFIVVLFFSGYLANRTVNAPWLENDIRIASFMLVTFSLNSAQLGILGGMKKFKEIAKIEIYSAIVSVPLFFLFTYLLGVRGAVISYLLYSLLLCVFSRAAINKEMELKKIYLKDAFSERSILLKFSLPAMLAGVCVLPVKWYSEVMLINSCGFREMGLFSAVLLVALVVQSVANTMNTPLLSYLSSDKDNKYENVNLYINWIIGLIICIPLIILYEIPEYFFGKDFSGDRFNKTLIIVLLYTIVTMYRQGLSRIFQVHEMQWLGLLSNLVWGCILLASFYYLKKYGSVGLSLSYLIAYVLITLVMYPVYFIRKWIPKSFLLSTKNVLVWAGTFLISYISLINAPIFIRILGLTLIVFLASYYRKKIIEKWLC